MMKTIYQLSLALLLCLIIKPAIAKEVEFPPPKNATVNIVGNNMAVGGKVMSIRQFYTKDKIDKVRRFYQQRWKKGEIKDLPGYTETIDHEPWHIISRLQEGHLLTVQMQTADDGGTWGYLASSPLIQEQANTSAIDAFPKLPGSQIIHDIQTKDIGQKGTTMLITNEKSLNSNANYYKNYYQQRGYRTDLDMPVETEGGYVMAFTKGRNKVNFVLKKVGNSTYITVNDVTLDLL